MVRLPIPVLALALMAGACGGSESSGPPAEDVAAGRVIEVSGAVSAERRGPSGAPARRTLNLGDEVAGVDVVVTAADASVTIELDHNGARWTLDGSQRKQLSHSAAWRAPRQGTAEALAGERDDHTAAAGRQAEREAASTRATGGVRPMMPEGRAEENAPAPVQAVPPPSAPSAPPPPRLDEGKMGKAEPRKQTGQYEMKRPPPRPPSPPPPAKPSAPMRTFDEAPAPKLEPPPRPSPPPPPPPPSESPPPPDQEVSGAISPAVIQKVVRAQMAGFRTCWESSGQKGELKVTLRLGIAADGHVSSATADGAAGTLATCLSGKARAMKFPSPGAPVSINYPLQFSSQ